MNVLYFAVGLPVVDFNATLKNVLTITFGAVALLSVLFVVIGGFKYVTSGGSPDGVKKAKDTILYALIGLAVALLANVIVSIVLGRLQ